MITSTEDNFIYALYCPYTNKPVYVGQTTRGMVRPLEHIKKASHSAKVNDWVYGLEQDEKEPIIAILDHGFDNSLLLAKEKFWIDYFISKGHYLLNSNSVTPLTIESLEFERINQNDPMYDIRVYIKSRRKLMKLSQNEMSQKSGVGLRFIREIEQSNKTNFNTDSVVRLLSFLGRVKLTIGDMDSPVRRNFIDY